MTIEIGKEYIYNNELDVDANGIGDEFLKAFNNDKCIVIEDNDTGVLIVSFNDFPVRVYKRSLSPIPEEPTPPPLRIINEDRLYKKSKKVKHNCIECDHDAYDCAICTKNDDSKYKRAWEALPERLGGKIKVSTLVIILKIMDEVIYNESN